MNNGINNPINLSINQIYGNSLTTTNKGKRAINNHENNLLSSMGQANQIKILPEEEGKYNKILKAFNMPVTEELQQALKILDLHGVNLSKENLSQFVTTKNQLDELINQLDYDTAIELTKHDIDIENDSLEEVVEKLEEIKKEGKSFSLGNLLRKFKSMSTDEAEEVALKLYGNKQGKDITDVIKALDKAGMEINKKNINRINDVFDKLHNIKDYHDEGLVEAVKSKVDHSIDQLYKMKNAIKKGGIAIEEKLSHYASKIYESFNTPRQKPTERDLKLLEEDIRDLLDREGISTSKESIALAKTLIKYDMEVSKENINKVYQLKEDIQTLVRTLDKEKIAMLMMTGHNVEKEKIKELIQLVKDMEDLNLELQLIKETPTTDDGKLEKIFDKISKLGEVTDEELLLLLNKGEDFKLQDIQRVRFSSSLSTLPEGKQSEVYRGTANMIGLLNQIPIDNLNVNTIGNYIRSNIPVTIEKLAIGNEFTERQGQSPSNEVQQIFKQMSFIRSNLTASMIATGIEKGLQLEKMELGKVTDFINNQQMEKGNWKLIEMLPHVKQQGEHLLAVLLKNNIPINLKEIQQINHFMKNENQIGQQLQEIFEKMEKEAKEALKVEIASMKLQVKEMSDEMKGGKIDIRKFNQDLMKLLKDLEGMGSQLDKEARDEISKGLKKLSQSIETQNNLNQKDTAIQMPIMMDNHIKNLQVYVMNEKQGSKKIDPKNMSVLLNMDTNSMGNINVYLGVNYRQLTLKVGVKYKENKDLMEANLPTLKTMLSNLGYDIKEISFKVDEEIHLMSMVEEAFDNKKTAKYSIDMMI